jgi:hypothetical protein
MRLVDHYSANLEAINEVNFKPSLDIKNTEEKKRAYFKTYNDKYINEFFKFDVLKEAVRNFTDMIFQNVEN